MPIIVAQEGIRKRVILSGSLLERILDVMTNPKIAGNRNEATWNLAHILHYDVRGFDALSDANAITEALRDGRYREYQDGILIII